jgi:hypothetical protein
MPALKLRLQAGLLVASAALAGWAAAAQADPLTPTDAVKHPGETVTVCGQVVGAKFAAWVRGGTTFLDFGKPYPDTPFTALIFASDRAKFGTPEKTAQGKDFCVTGKIEMYQGKPQIVLKDPKQLSEKVEKAAASATSP